MQAQPGLTQQQHHERFARGIAGIDMPNKASAAAGKELAKLALKELETGNIPDQALRKASNYQPLLAIKQASKRSIHLITGTSLYNHSPIYQPFYEMISQLTIPLHRT
jgi:hypothetical protein